MPPLAVISPLNAGLLGNQPLAILPVPSASGIKPAAGVNEAVPPVTTAAALDALTAASAALAAAAYSLTAASAALAAAADSLEEAAKALAAEAIT